MRNGRKPTIEVNQGYFNEIDNEQKAYWLGFIWADGHVAQKAPWTVIVQIKDIEHLQQFANAIGYTGEIKTVKGSGFNSEAIHGRLVICRKTMCDVLNKLGRNNENMSIPNISKKLIPHFIRGYFDGDGSVYETTSTVTNKYGSKYKYRNLEVQIIGHKPYLEQIEKHFNDVGITCTYKNSKTDYMKYLKIDGGRNHRALYEYMYNDSTISLARKKDKWQLLYTTSPYGERSL